MIYTGDKMHLYIMFFFFTLFNDLHFHNLIDQWTSFRFLTALLDCKGFMIMKCYVRRMQTANAAIGIGIRVEVTHTTYN